MVILMKHTIDMKKYQLRTDLAIEVVDENFEQETETVNDIKVTKIKLDSLNAKKLDKKEGKYITIEFEDVTDHENRKNLKQVFCKELKKLVKGYENILVIGLGNEDSTPDSLGPVTIKNVLVTRHLFLSGEVEDGFSMTSAFATNVMGTTGIETVDIIKGITQQIKPDLVIVIDALASQSLERLNKTIQITDTGIHPGSGVSNSRKEISFETLNVPVIAIGVPTVVDAICIVCDTFNFIYKNYEFNKEYLKKPMSKLTFQNVNYLKKNLKANEEERRNLLGLIGTLTDSEIRSLLNEVLSPIGYNFMVTPKEIDFVIKNLSEVLADGINLALHSKLNEV